MKNSICLPLPTSLHSPHCRARCFIVYPNRAEEVHPYPFTLAAIKDLNETRKVTFGDCSYRFEWCTILFFPESWPPDLIECYLRARTAMPELYED